MMQVYLYSTTLYKMYLRAHYSTVHVILHGVGGSTSKSPELCEMVYASCLPHNTNTLTISGDPEKVVNCLLVAVRELFFF